VRDRLFRLMGILIAPAGARAADPDWKAWNSTRQAGQLQPGDVFRIGMPRTDLAVTVKGVRSRRICVGIYAAFKQAGDRAMSWAISSCSTGGARGDVRLFGGGLEVTAVHNT